MVEAERASLAQKIQAQMEPMLEAAVRDRMATQKELTETRADLDETHKILSELELAH